MEQIILETALLIVKWGSKGFPGGRRRDGAYIGLFLFYRDPTLCDIWHTDYRTISETVTPESDTGQVLSQCMGKSTDGPDLKPICLLCLLHLCLNSWAPWGQVMVSCSLLSPQHSTQFWAQDRQVGTGEHLVSERWATVPARSYDMLTALLSYHLMR